MTAVIFGGSGFVGRHLAEWLVTRGEPDVLIADIVPPPFAMPAGVRHLPCDVREPITLDVAPGPLVYNLAAVHRSPGPADHEYSDTNVAGAHHVVDFATRSEATTVIFTSSISVHEPSEAPITESTPPDPSSAYGLSKLEAERIQAEWALAAAGRTLVIARPGAVFGAGEQGNFTRLAHALERRRFAYPGRRDTVKACGYVIDLVESLEFARAFAHPTVVYNFCFPRPPSIEEVCEAFAEVGGYRKPRFVIPTPAMLAAARVLGALGSPNYDADRVRKLVQSTYVVPEFLIAEGYPFRFDLRAALRDWYASAPSGQFV
jgi:nucleoside-diphosphate-sugar epimerase